MRLQMPSWQQINTVRSHEVGSSRVQPVCSSVRPSSPVTGGGGGRTISDTASPTLMLSLSSPGYFYRNIVVFDRIQPQFRP